MHVARNIAGWLGTSMTGLATIFGQQYWFGEASHHTPKIFWSMIGCLAVACGCFLFWFFTRSKGEGGTSQTTHGPKSPIFSGNTAGRDFRQVIAETYNEAPVPPPEPPPDPKPSIEISGPEPSHILWNRIWWQLGVDKGSPAFIIWIHNKPADEGFQRGKALNASVSLTFRESGRILTHITHAYWLSHSENARTLKPSDRYAVLLATIYGASLKAYDNRKEPDNTIRLTRPTIGSLTATHVLRDQVVNFNSLLEIDVAVLSEGTTLAKRTFQYIKAGNNLMRFTDES